MAIDIDAVLSRAKEIDTMKGVGQPPPDVELSAPTFTPEEQEEIKKGMGSAKDLLGAVKGTARIVPKIPGAILQAPQAISEAYRQRMGTPEPPLYTGITGLPGTAVRGLSRGMAAAGGGLNKGIDYLSSLLPGSETAASGAESFLTSPFALGKPIGDLIQQKGGSPGAAAIGELGTNLLPFILAGSRGRPSPLASEKGLIDFRTGKELEPTSVLDKAAKTAEEWESESPSRQANVAQTGIISPVEPTPEGSRVIGTYSSPLNAFRRKLTEPELLKVFRGRTFPEILRSFFDHEYGHLLATTREGTRLSDFLRGNVPPEVLKETQKYVSSPRVPEYKIPARAGSELLAGTSEMIDPRSSTTIRAPYSGTATSLYDFYRQNPEVYKRLYDLYQRAQEAAPEELLSRPPFDPAMVNRMIEKGHDPLSLGFTAEDIARSQREAGTIPRTGTAGGQLRPRNLISDEPYEIKTDATTVKTGEPVSPVKKALDERNRFRSTGEWVKAMNKKYGREATAEAYKMSKTGQEFPEEGMARGKSTVDDLDSLYGRVMKYEAGTHPDRGLIESNPMARIRFYNEVKREVETLPSSKSKSTAMKYLKSVVDPKDPNSAMDIELAAQYMHEGLRRQVPNQETLLKTEYGVEDANRIIDKLWNKYDLEGTEVPGHSGLEAARYAPPTRQQRIQMIMNEKGLNSYDARIEEAKLRAQGHEFNDLNELENHLHGEDFEEGMGFPKKPEEPYRKYEPEKETPLGLQPKVDINPAKALENMKKIRDSAIIQAHKMAEAGDPTTGQTLKSLGDKINIMNKRIAQIEGKEPETFATPELGPIKSPELSRVTEIGPEELAKRKEMVRPIEPKTGQYQEPYKGAKYIPDAREAGRDTSKYDYRMPEPAPESGYQLTLKGRNWTGQFTLDKMGRIVEAPKQAKWSVGKEIGEVLDYYKRRGILRSTGEEGQKYVIQVKSGDRWETLSDEGKPIETGSEESAIRARNAAVQRGHYAPDDIRVWSMSEEPTLQPRTWYEKPEVGKAPSEGAARAVAVTQTGIEALDKILGKKAAERKGVKASTKGDEALSKILEKPEEAPKPSATITTLETKMPDFLKSGDPTGSAFAHGATLTKAQAIEIWKEYRNRTLRDKTEHPSLWAGTEEGKALRSKKMEEALKDQLFRETVEGFLTKGKVGGRTLGPHEITMRLGLKEGGE